jgi:hypothetical protein
MTLRNIGIERIISSIRIDEWSDKKNTLEGRINSVKEKVKKQKWDKKIIYLELFLQIIFMTI